MHCSRFVTIAIAVTLVPLSITSRSYAQAHTKGREVAPLTPALKPGDYVWHPEVAPAGPVVILVSLPDQLLYVYRNGLRNTALESFDSSGRREWISTASSGRRRVPNLKDLANRVGISSDFDDDIRSLITPGTTLVVTNLPVGTGTHSAPGFNILTD
jgi:hypothetical protein